MKNQRLFTIAEFIDSTNLVADIGCDHGYLAIYLKQIKKCPLVIASDVNENALSVARDNILKEELQDEIPCILSDGVSKLPVPPLDTLVIAGMGTHTILDILQDDKTKLVTNFILQSNNDFYLLRKMMQEQGFFLEKEAYVLEHGHDYFVMKYVRKEQTLTDLELRYGIFNSKNLVYYERCYQKNLKILDELPPEKYEVSEEIKKEVIKLQELISRC